MAVFILGIIDLFIALIILGAKFFPKSVILFAAFYIILKGLLFVLSNDAASYVDIAAGIYMMFIAAGFSLSLLSILFTIFLVQKGLFSLS